MTTLPESGDAPTSPAAAATRRPSSGTWPWRHRLALIVGAAIVTVLFVLVLFLNESRATTYGTYKDFIERGRTAADERGREAVTRSSLISAFGVPTLVRPDDFKWVDARGEYWYYELKVGGAAVLQVIGSRDNSNELVRVRRTSYVDPGEFARIQRGP